MPQYDFSGTSMVELAEIITEHLETKDFNVVLVGGLAVAIYTEDRYLTKDIDIFDITQHHPQKLHEAMGELGFQKQGKVFRHKSTPITVEFPGGNLQIADEPVPRDQVLKTEGGLPILPAAYVVKDRLAHDLYFQDPQAIIQALCVMLVHTVAPEKIKAFCIHERNEDYYNKVKGYYLDLEASKTTDMESIEAYILEKKLEEL